MKKSADACPYLLKTSTGVDVQITLEEDFELQYNEEHIVEKVKVGETDLVKEVNSHINEVGLVNVIKNAIAHGEDPMTKFAKVEPGIMSGVPLNATMDELIELSEQNKAKYADIAKTLGVTVDELQNAIALGTLDKLISKPKEEVTEEGGAE